MLVDSHCHLDCLDLANHEGSLDNAIQAARLNDVSLFLCVCIDLENFPAVLKIAEAYPYIHASVGTHPNTTEGHDPSVEELIKLADHPKIVAIGETGLDYFRVDEQSDWQIQRFRTHIRAATACQLPLIIHTRDAETDTINVMRQEGADKAGGVMHCFTGTMQMAELAMELGFYISFSGIVTFKNATALQEVASQIPLERMLIETDSPYLAPVPFRGKSNEPAYVKHVAEYIAELRNISYAELADITTHNYKSLFKIEV